MSHYIYRCCSGCLFCSCYLQPEEFLVCAASSYNFIYQKNPHTHTYTHKNQNNLHIVISISTIPKHSRKVRIVLAKNPQQLIRIK